MIDIEVEAAAWTQALADVEILARMAADAALAKAAPRGGGATILLTDDSSVRDLNARFRQKDAATNVLSFPAPANPEDHLGDIALAFETCLREAREQGKPLAHHLQHLVVHGVLHLLGYDHIGDDEAEAMERLEATVLAGLGVPDPYAVRDGDDERA